MRPDPFAAKIAYACIFTRTIEEASANLVRLITSGDCGFDEGAEASRAWLTVQLETADDFSQLNTLGASFTSAQWRSILEQVRTGLLTMTRDRT